MLQCNDVHSNPGPVRGNYIDSNKKALSICCVNERSLVSKYKVSGHGTDVSVNKYDEFEAFALFNNFDIMLVSETWLSDTIGDDVISVPGYLPPLRRDRNRHGGGLAIYISENVPSNRKLQLKSQDIECMCIEVGFGIEKILICSTYIPPN